MRNPELSSVKYSQPLLTCTVLKLFYNYLQNNLSPCMHNYFIYYLRLFLRIFIIDYPALNIAINSSTPYSSSNIFVTPFSSQLSTDDELHIIILAPSVGYKKVNYDWAHKRIMDRNDSYWTHYEYYGNKYEYITQLTPDLL